ncbi:MAG: FtsX-like permease family protein [Pseudomonadota bacterium]
MFHHLLKLIWKRKGRNLMLSLEILLAFVLVFAISAFGLRYYQLYQLPIGFDAGDVWSVRIQGAGQSDAAFTPEAYDQLKRGLLAMPGAREVAFINAPPFTNSTWNTDFKVDGRQVKTELVQASDEIFTVLGIDLIEGRAYDRRDDGQAQRPVVINARLALEMFGTTKVVGKVFEWSERGEKENGQKRVVGVVSEFRNKGELAAPRNMALARQIPGSSDALRSILIKMEPGTPRAFEETLTRQLKLINNAWTYQIAPLPALRTTAMRDNLTPILILSVIAAFLLLMVAFGLFGVLWQNTTRRIPEIGLRRAIGAHAGDIYRQIIAEQFLLSSGAMLVALLLLVQLPITGALGEGLNWTVFGAATLLSMAVIYLLSLLCSVYPGWRASRLSPTQALHYE